MPQNGETTTGPDKDDSFLTEMFPKWFHKKAKKIDEMGGILVGATYLNAYHNKLAANPGRHEENSNWPQLNYSETSPYNLSAAGCVKTIGMLRETNAKLIDQNYVVEMIIRSFSTWMRILEERVGGSAHSNDSSGWSVGNYDVTIFDHNLLNSGHGHHHHQRTPQDRVIFHVHLDLEGLFHVTAVQESSGQLVNIKLDNQYLDSRERAKAAEKMASIFPPPGNRKSSTHTTVVAMDTRTIVTLTEAKAIAMVDDGNNSNVKKPVEKNGGGKVVEEGVRTRLKKFVEEIQVKVQQEREKMSMEDGGTNPLILDRIRVLLKDSNSLLAKKGNVSVAALEVQLGKLEKAAARMKK